MKLLKPPDTRSSSIRNPSSSTGYLVYRSELPDNSRRRSRVSKEPPECPAGHTLALTCLAGVFGQWGKRSEAAAVYRELTDRASRSYISATHLAIAAEAAGLREEAVASARRAWEEREPPFILWARHFPQFGPLRADPRFAAILHEMDSA